MGVHTLEANQAELRIESGLQPQLTLFTVRFEGTTLRIDQKLESHCETVRELRGLNMYRLHTKGKVAQ